MSTTFESASGDMPIQTTKNNDNVVMSGVYSETQFLTTEGNQSVFLRHWFGDTQHPKAIVQIVHGMAEHSLRYEHLAEALVKAGYVVYADDHRGHGETAKRGVLGHYADENGWELIVNDLYVVNQHIQQKYADAPIILLGHSMGAFMTQYYLLKYPETIHAAVLSGAGYGPPMKFKAGKLVAKIEALRQGAKGNSKLLDFISFGSYNKKFKPNRTDFDWLSRDPKEVDQYMNDPLCGFLCTNQLWIDMLGALAYIYSPENIKQLPKQMPIYFLSGDRDPLGENTKAFFKLISKVKSAGLEDIHYDLYPDGRHEMFNETNRDEVYFNLVAWLNKHFAKNSHS